MKNSKTKILFIVVLLLLGWFFLACSQQTPNQSRSIKLAITKIKSENNPDSYRNWLHRYDSTVHWVSLYPLSTDSAIKALKTCDGLLCTGGGDIYPALYGKLNELNECGPPDRHRDSLELKAINLALHLKMPILGICRGLQIINVALGGTLYTDLPTDIGIKVVHRTLQGRHSWHEVYLNKKSELYTISHADSGRIYSHHHQGIEKSGKRAIDKCPID